MDKIDLEERKKILLKILIYISNFCEEKNINWFLGYGTLLGAIRHKGFIPWDDDIDILMMRKDYMRFIKLFNTEQSEYGLVSFEDGSYYFPFSKIIDLNTAIKNRVMIDYPKQGICVDVFVMDYISDKFDEAQKNMNICLRHKLLLAIAAYRNRAWIMGKHQFLKHGIYTITHIIGCRVISEGYRIYLKKYQKEERKKYCGCVGENEIILPSAIFDNIKYVDFEGYKFPAPSKYDTYLEAYYGNYMILPPEEERLPHPEEAYYIN